MPVSRNDHHSQFSATPRSRTRFVTRFGVSVLKVVATIETPTSHQGAARPEVKNSAVLDPALFAKKIAGRNEMTMLMPMIVQSRVVKCIEFSAGGENSGAKLPIDYRRRQHLEESDRRSFWRPFRSSVWRKPAKRAILTDPSPPEFSRP